jgi:dipeptidyl aminopeptidase/acylaminoacyl peptidase
VLKSSAPMISTPTISPDGRRLALVVGAYDRVNMPTGAGKRSVWVHQLEPPADIRLTPEDGDYALPAWFPSGDRVVVNDQVSQVGGTKLIALSADGSGSARQLGDGCCAQVMAVGDRLLFGLEDRGRLRLRHAAVGPNGSIESPQRVFSTDPEPTVCCADQAAVSPSGRLLAYVDVNASGAATLLLTRFPNGEGRWHVATAQSRDAILGLRWARKTNELFFLKADATPTRARLTSVAVTDGATVTVGPPSQLFEVTIDSLRGSYDVSPDGKTFYMARRAAVTADQRKAQRYVLIQNWIAELNRQR